MKKPFISVVAIAYNRKEYIGAALTSVINQTLSRELFEIILVTNLEIDPHLIELGDIRVIHSDIKAIGPKAAIALPRCRGEVVCFLEDDDEWASTKLEKVFSLFTEHPEIGYFHNGMAFIDEEGNDFDPKGQLANWKSGTGEVMWLHPLNDSRPEGSVNSMVSFNTSCMAMRKATIVRFSNYLEQIKRSVDKFLFYAAVTDNCGIYSSSIELTRYRVHESTSTVYNMNDFKAFCAKQAGNTSDYFGDFSAIHDMCNLSGSHDLERETEILRIWFKFNGDLFWPRARRILIYDYVTVLKLLLSIRFRNRWLVTISILSFISLLWPEVPRHIIFTYYSSG